MHNQNIDLVRVETKKIITEFQKLINELKKDEELKDKNEADDQKTLSLKKLKNDFEILENEKKKLDSKEYVISVVGTMKAGKSMTINAIVGQEILPSRVEAMTTLPTIITHKKGQDIPILTIKKIEVFTELLNKVQNNVDKYTDDSEDIKKLIDSIQNNKIKFKDKYQGREEIENFLRQLNDLMRVAKEIDINPPYDKFESIDEIPRIEVEFYHLSKDESSGDSKFSLLDTPGPDEFKHSELLKEIFKKQIERSSGIMLLVDYTKMNNKSDVEVKEQIDEVAGLIGKKHLFVLINKFDQRKRKEDDIDTKEKVIKTIATDILKDKIDKESIFPVSAKSAFYANIGLRELDKKGYIDTSLDWVPDFGVVLMGEDWEDDIEDEKRVRKKCCKLWEKSFFEEALNQVIKKLHNEVDINYIEQPINKVCELLRKYNNVFKTHKNAYQLKLKELKQIIKTITEDINNIIKISKNIEKEINDYISNIENNIENKSKETIIEISNRIKFELDNNINKVKKEEKDRRNKGHKVNNNSILHKELWEGGLFDFFTKNKDEQYDTFREEGLLEFSDLDELQKFIDKLNKFFTEVVKDKYIKQTEVDINENINKLKTNINTIIQKKLGVLLKKIEQKFAENGDSLNIILPQLDVNIKIDFKDSLFEGVKQEKKEYKERGKDWWSKFKNWFNSDWGTETKYKDIYIVENSTIISNIEISLKEIQDSAINKLNNEFKTKIKNPINLKLQQLIQEIESYRAEQEEILQEKEKKDKFFIEKKIQITHIYQKKIKKITERLANINKQCDFRQSSKEIH